MKYIISGEIIEIPTEKKPYNQGSEGKIYKLGEETYKIYHDNAINEGYGSKERHHKELLNIPTKQIILPTDLIYTTEENYAGYKAPFIKGENKKKTGISQIENKKFIKNLQILENDFALLAKNYILAADVSHINYIYNQETSTMYVIDPGRYKSHYMLNKEICQKQNTEQLRSLIEWLLYLDFIEYKPVKTKRKASMLREKIKEKAKNTPYSEFFMEELKEFENVHQYAKSLEKYIK